MQNFKNYANSKVKKIIPYYEITCLPTPPLNTYNHLRLFW